MKVFTLSVAISIFSHPIYGERAVGRVQSSKPESPDKRFSVARPDLESGDSDRVSEAKSEVLDQMPSEEKGRSAPKSGDSDRVLEVKSEVLDQMPSEEKGRSAPKSGDFDRVPEAKSEVLDQMPSEEKGRSAPKSGDSDRVPEAKSEVLDQMLSEEKGGSAPKSGDFDRVPEAKPEVLDQMPSEEKGGSAPKSGDFDRVPEAKSEVLDQMPSEEKGGSAPKSGDFDRVPEAKSEVLDQMPSEEKGRSVPKSKDMDSQQTQKIKKENIKPGKSNTGISEKVEKIFSVFIEILEEESIDSKKYIQAVEFLENSLYDKIDFQTLKTLARVYKNKEDFKNQLKVLNILTIGFPNKAEGFYLLGEAYKHLYFNQLENKDENKNNSIESFNRTLKINPKYISVYKSLIYLLKSRNKETNQDYHTLDSLYVVIDMLKNIQNPIYYIDLCKAYYDNNFFKTEPKSL